MRNKIFTFFIILFCANTIIFAQQEAQFSQFMFNTMALNPGYAGSNGAICLNTFFRQQWAGFKDPDGSSTAPQTILFTIDAPVKFLHGGLGAVISSDKAGFEKNTLFRLAYAYRVNLGSGFLGIGVEAAFDDKKIDFAKFRTSAVDASGNQLSPETDAVIAAGLAKGGEFYTDFAFGAYYNIPGKFYAGISALNLTEPKNYAWKAIDATSPVQSGFGYALKRTYFITGGYEYVFPSNPSFELDPSVLVKTDFVTAQYDIAALLKYENRFWGGLSYRVQDAVTIMAGLNWNNFKFGYSYDITTSKLGGAGKSNGSHELFLRYCFKIEIPHPVKSYKNTRYL
ncbi:MAG: type IX secretion system membrane protein PorP/SprF [Bacteroidetes bacterium]|nr:type IX secretion system membrane protein PorP/SprF [Bacteroidota bacterium]